MIWNSLVLHYFIFYHVGNQLKYLDFSFMTFLIHAVFLYLLLFGLYFIRLYDREVAQFFRILLMIDWERVRLLLFFFFDAKTHNEGKH